MASEQTKRQPPPPPPPPPPPAADHTHWKQDGSQQCELPDCRWFCQHHQHRHGEIVFPSSEVHLKQKSCPYCRLVLTIRQQAPTLLDIEAYIATGPGKTELMWELTSSFTPERILAFSTEDVAHPPGLVLDGTFTLGSVFRPVWVDISAEQACECLKPLPTITGMFHSDLRSDHMLEQTRNWTSQCDDEHDLCRTGGPRILPTRVLDVRHFIDSGIICLYETCGEVERYIALSYCWGDVEAPLITTTHNMDLHKRGISVGELPRSYADLCWLACKLDVPYIWIDALCIIQDAVEDWEIEASKMANVYKDAYLTVISASAENPHQPLLDKRTKEHQWHSFDFNGPPGHHHKVKIRKARVYNYDMLEFTPILKRAWCFQERLTARRCLIYTAKEVFWECRTCCRSESSGSLTHFEPRVLVPTSIKNGDEVFFASPEAAYTKWLRTVEQYTRKRLSVATDRLPAISALAAAVHNATGDEYLAGLWRGDLILQLMWQAWGLKGEVYTMEESTRYISPTWSWAGYPNQIIYTFAQRQLSKESSSDYIATVVHASCTAKGRNLFGAVSDGYLDLYGIYCEAVLHVPAPGGSERDLFIRLKPPDGRLLADDILHISLDGKVIAVGSCLTMQRVLTSGAVQERCKGEVVLFWLTNRCCLVLAQSIRQPACYERLGIATRQDSERTMDYVASAEDIRPRPLFGQVRIL